LGDARCVQGSIIEGKCCPIPSCAVCSTISFLVSLLTGAGLLLLLLVDFQQHNMTSLVRGSPWEKLDKLHMGMKAPEVVLKLLSLQIQILIMLLLKKQRQHF
jgi:hypothetical protein